MSGELIEHSDRANDLKWSVKISNEWLRLLKDKFETIPTATKNLQTKIDKLNLDLPENDKLSPANTALRNQIKSEISWLNEKAADKSGKSLEELAKEILPPEVIWDKNIIINNGKVILVSKVAQAVKGNFNKGYDAFTNGLEALKNKNGWAQIDGLAEKEKAPEWQAVAELRNYWIPFTVDQKTGKITVNPGNNTNMAGWKSAFNNAQIEATADANKRNPQTAQK